MKRSENFHQQMYSKFLKHILCWMLTMDKLQVADYQTETKQVACITLLNILLHIKTVVLYLNW